MTQVEVYKACHEAFALLHGRFREVPEFIVISGDDGSCVVRHSGVDWWMKGDCIRTIVPGHHGFNFGGITVEESWNRAVPSLSTRWSNLLRCCVMSEPYMNYRKHANQALGFLEALRQEFHNVPLHVSRLTAVGNTWYDLPTIVWARPLGGDSEVARWDEYWRPTRGSEPILDMHLFLSVYCTHPKDPLERLAEIKA